MSPTEAAVEAMGNLDDPQQLYSDDIGDVQKV